jgi:hypothetical protein
MSSRAHVIEAYVVEAHVIERRVIERRSSRPAGSAVRRTTR